MRGGPVYIVKPKYIFKHPFNKYDLANPTNRETQNEELTDYFNYGFNEDTMNIYGKLVKRFIEVLDHHKNLEYFNQPSELMRLNDQMPMDFGGFCKFHDPSIVDNETPQNFHSGQPLMRYFIMMIFANASRKIEYPLIQFIKQMYKKEGEEDTQDTALFDIIQQIGKNLEQKYEETLKKLIDKQNQAKNPPQKKVIKDQRKEYPRERERQRQRERQNERPYKEKDRQRERDRGDKEREKERERERQVEKPVMSKQKSQSKKEKGDKKSRSESSSGSEDDSSDSQSSNETEGKKKRRDKDDRSKSEKKGKRKDKDRDRKKRDKERREKHKSKKVKKEKSHRRSKSRDRKKKHH